MKFSVFVAMVLAGITAKAQENKEKDNRTPKRKHFEILATGGIVYPQNPKSGRLGTYWIGANKLTPKTSDVYNISIGTNIATGLSAGISYSRATLLYSGEVLSGTPVRKDVYGARPVNSLGAYFKYQLYTGRISPYARFSASYGMAKKITDVKGVYEADIIPIQFSIGGTYRIIGDISATIEAGTSKYIADERHSTISTFSGSVGIGWKF
ncbi:MAG: hypothetical protein JNM41_04330 [Flavipsychrobacter sp.]|nr:hypothetical protein [Flavipsychrobacter sp.]